MIPLDLQRRQRLQERDDVTHDDDVDTDWAFPARQEPLSATALAQLRAWHLELEDDQ